MALETNISPRLSPFLLSIVVPANRPPSSTVSPVTALCRARGQLFLSAEDGAANLTALFVALSRPESGLLATGAPAALSESFALPLGAWAAGAPLGALFDHSAAADRSDAVAQI